MYTLIHKDTGRKTFFYLCLTWKKKKLRKHAFQVIEEESCLQEGFLSGSDSATMLFTKKKKKGGLNYLEKRPLKSNLDIWIQGFFFFF